MALHFISEASSRDKSCNCGSDATHKVGEHFSLDGASSSTHSHEVTAYLCCKHFALLYAEATFCHIDECC